MAAAAAVKMTSSESQSGQYPGYGPISGMSRQVHALAPVQPPVHGAMSAMTPPGYPFSSYHSMFPPTLAAHDPSSLFFSDISSGAAGYGYQHNPMYGSYMNGMAGSPFFRYKVKSHLPHFEKLSGLHLLTKSSVNTTHYY